MTENEIGKILSAQLFSLMRDSQYSYSGNPRYSSLNDSGKKIMADLVDILVSKVVECQQQIDKDQAEKIVMDNLKK